MQASLFSFSLWRCFLLSKEHDPHRLCIACRGKSYHPDDRYNECHEWSEKHCRSIAEYAEKLSLQHGRKKERKMKSSSSSFSGFSPSMPVPLEQLSSADSRVITTSSSTAVCAMTFVLASPSVTSAPVTSTPGLLVPEFPRKRRPVTDSKEHELMLANFEDWWASGRSAPRPGPSFASQPLLVTPPVVPVPGLSSALVIPAVAAPSASSRSVASSRSAERLHLLDSPGSHLVLAPPAVPDLSLDNTRSIFRTCQPSEGHLHSRDPSPSRSQSHSRTRHPSGGRLQSRDPLPTLSRSHSQTRHPSRGHQLTRDLSPSRSQSCSRTHRSSDGCQRTWNPSPSCSWFRSQTHHLFGGRQRTQDPFPRRSRSQIHHLSGGHSIILDPSASCSRTRRPSGGHLLQHDPSAAWSRSHHPSGGRFGSRGLCTSRSQSRAPGSPSSERGTSSTTRSS